MYRLPNPDPEKVRLAVENGEVFEYMTGQETEIADYEVFNPHISTPTEPFEAWKALKKWVTENDRPDVWQQVREGIIKMSKDEKYSWFVLYWLDRYYLWANDGLYTEPSPEDFVQEILDNVIALRPQLEADSSMLGYSHWNNVKANVQRWNERHDFKLTLD